MINTGLYVIFIDPWAVHVEAMRTNGLRVDMLEETVSTRIPAFHVSDVARFHQFFNVVFLGVKAYHTRWACELFRPRVAEDGLVVGLQNGMTMDDVASIMGRERTLGAVIEVAAGLLEPGLVTRQTGPAGTWFGVGAFDETTVGREHNVAEILKHTGALEVRDDIRSAKWMKLVVNASEFLPSSILNLPLADAVAIPGIREVMMASGREAVSTGLAMGHDLVPIFGSTRIKENDPDHYATVFLDAVLTHWTLPETKVTTLQDWTRGRRAEVDDINGVVVREQAIRNGAAPVNARLVEIAHQIERGELDADPGNADLLRLILN